MTQMNTQRERTPGTGGYIFGMIACLLLLALAVLLIFVGFYGMDTGEMPSFFGYSAYISQPDNPEVSFGAAVITDRSQTDLQSGWLAYRDESLASSNQIMVQYVYQNDAEGMHTCTRDGQNIVIVAPGQARGHAIAYTPMLGSVLAFAQSGMGVIVLIVAAVLLAALLVSLAVKCAMRRRERKHKEDAYGLSGGEKRALRRRAALSAEFISEDGSHGSVLTADRAAFIPSDSPEPPADFSCANAGAPDPSFAGEQSECPAGTEEQPTDAEIQPSAPLIALTRSGSPEEILLMQKIARAVFEKRGSQDASAEVREEAGALTLDLRCTQADADAIALLMQKLSERS